MRTGRRPCVAYVLVRRLRLRGFEDGLAAGLTFGLGDSHGVAVYQQVLLHNGRAASALLPDHGPLRVHTPAVGLDGLALLNDRRGQHIAFLFLV